MPPQTDFEMISVFVDSELTAEVLEKFPNLKLIATQSTGFDHIDLEYCRSKNITVSSVPSYGENTVAEYAFALILCLSRKIYEGYDRLREIGSFSFEGLRGFDLKGKTIGVIGTGHIGRHVIKIAKGFEMNILAYDPMPTPRFAEETGFTYLSFEEVLAKSDVVTFHVPLTEQTRHMVNERTLNLMKKGAYIINTSRGGIVDTQALVKALKEGRLGGAGVDVMEEEDVLKDEMTFLMKGREEEHNLKTILADHILIDTPNVIVTPHNAFNTDEALQRILDTTMANISGFIRGAPLNVVK